LLDFGAKEQIQIVGHLIFPWVRGYTGWAKKTGPFLNVDNFAMVSDRKACDVSKVWKFCLEKSVKLA